MKFASLATWAIVLFSLIFSHSFFAQSGVSVGVSPGSIDLGLVEKGSTKLVDFYIITPSEESLIIRLEPENVVLDANSISKNSSEEDILSWIKIVNNPVELKPNTEPLETTGGSIRSHRQVSFLIEIPENAEPGRHVMNMKPVPLTSAESIGTVGSAVVAITSIKVMFDIVGNPIRKGVILDVENGYYTNGVLDLKTYFQNTGNVTISASGTQKIYDNSGKLVGEIYLGNAYVKPKEIKVFSGRLKNSELSFEEYNVYTAIDYKTGTAEKASLIKLSPPTALVLEERKENMLLLILILVIVAVSIIIYRRVK